MKWIKEGDSNSRFFHQMLKLRIKINHITTLYKDGEWVKGVSNNLAINSLFSNIFKEKDHHMPLLTSTNLRQRSKGDNISFTSLFLEDEIKDAVWNCDENKNPGPNRFNFKCIKRCWDLVKEDVVAFVNQFYAREKVPKVITTSFITLIIKKDHTQSLNDDRIICVICCLYKILSKLLYAG